MGLLDDDVDILLRDQPLEPVRVRYAGFETHGDFVDVNGDARSGLEQGESLEVQERTVRIRSGTLGDLERYTAITLIDTSGCQTVYTIRDARRVNDGRETVIVLVKE